MRGFEWKDGVVVILDQTALPSRQEHLTLRTTQDIAEAILRMRIRGAPALGIIGAYGVAQAAAQTISSSARAVFEAAETAGQILADTRPTAVNLAWAIERTLAAARPLVKTAGPQRVRQALLDEAEAIRSEDERACEAMAKHAFEFFEPEGVVLTHCNTGALVTGGIGTALGAIRHAHEQGIELAVIVTETRPLLQGSRLTAWELGRLGIPHAIVVDGAAPGLIARGEVQLVMVGADRIAANGDTANKVGTYGLALAAAQAGIPFIVVAPTSTVDLSTPSGGQIEVEERSGREVTMLLGQHQIAPGGSQALNPAFDVTPADFISAIVTENGVAEPPFERALPKLVGSRRRVAPKPAARKKPTPKKPAVKKPTPKKKPAAKKKPSPKKPAVIKKKPVKRKR